MLAHTLSRPAMFNSLRATGTADTADRDPEVGQQLAITQGRVGLALTRSDPLTPLNEGSAFTVCKQ